ncbi:hypothetical protein SDC9_202155 [bioreactor metagenome]|uniref:DNA binding HTH domain-containing protein n=1 Tax=bioreactor metagenome TaxID=1076179 RepID=A0A645ISV9_9ZZZZ
MPEILKKYIPEDGVSHLPVRTEGHGTDYLTDRDIIFKVLYQLRQEIDELKSGIVKNQVPVNTVITKREDVENVIDESNVVDYDEEAEISSGRELQDFSIHSMNADLIRKSLEKHNGKRKAAAAELGISERTLYRKIKELKLDI